MTQPDPAPQQAPEGGQQEPQQQQQSPQQQSDDTAPKFSQKWANDFEARVRREYQAKADRDKELVDKGKRFEQQQQEQQPLSERVTHQATEIAHRDTRITSLETEKLRMKLAWEAGLPPALGERVRGETEDEIKADIDTLKPLISQQQPDSTLRPNPQQGAPSSDNNRSSSLSAGRDLWAKRHGKKVDAAT